VVTAVATDSVFVGPSGVGLIPRSDP
jgi:hypothetical protein